MYGIDVSGGLAVLATAGPQPARVVGTAASLEDLGHMAPGLAGPTAAAAAAYANDVERQALRDAVIAAGFERVCLINRPTAALWAYRELAGLDGSNFVVVECGPGRTEITLARSDGPGYEILRADGLEIPDFDPDGQTVWIAGVLRGAPNLAPSAVVVIGDRRRCRDMAALLESALGVPVRAELDPETVVALGAAIFATRQPPAIVEARVAEPEPMVRTSRFGCAAVLAIVSLVGWRLV